MKIQKFLFPVLFAALAINQAAAQNADYRNVVSVHAGANLFQLASRVVGDLDNGGGVVTSSATPTFAVTYDRGIKNWFSIGFTGAYNKFTLDATDVTITDDETGIDETGDVNLDLARINASARMLFHYGNRGRVDMYSGLRLGANIRNIDFTSEGFTDLETDEVASVFSDGVGLNAQLILFGLRGYVTKNIGIGFETGIGGPYYAALQLNYRM